MSVSLTEHEETRRELWRDITKLCVNNLTRAGNIDVETESTEVADGVLRLYDARFKCPYQEFHEEMKD